VDYTQKSSFGIGKGSLFVCWQNHSIIKVCCSVELKLSVTRATIIQFLGFLRK